MNTSEVFKNLLNKLKKTRDLKYEKGKKFNLFLQNKLNKIIKTKFPRRKKVKFEEYSGSAEYKEYKLYFDKVCLKFWDFWEGEEKKIENKLVELSEKMPIARIDSFTFWKTTCSSTYSSQGYGAVSYAKDAAERLKQKAEHYGLECKVVQKDLKSDNKWGIAHAEFDVWVCADNLGLEILNRKPSVSLKEVVRSSWARGINIRVNYPFLPHGYEESIGINFFGQIINQDKWNRA